MNKSYKYFEDNMKVRSIASDMLTTIEQTEDGKCKVLFIYDPQDTAIQIMDMKEVFPGLYDLSNKYLFNYSYQYRYDSFLNLIQLYYQYSKKQLFHYYIFFLVLYLILHFHI